MIEIAPSILSADFARLGEQVDEALACGVKRIHCDVMDGHFVPNITLGPAVVAAVAPRAQAAGAITEVHLMITEVHLMITSPERYVADFVRAGGDLILVHVETCPHLERTLAQIREEGAQAGVVLNPATPLVALEEVLTKVDQALVMTVNPGFGGQKFIPSSLDKIRRLREMLNARGLTHVPIEVDGGVHPGTIADCERAGAQVAVAGSAVFNREGSVAANLRALWKAS